MFVRGKRGTSDYAEMTSSPYSSHAELKYALDNRIEILPLKVEAHNSNGNNTNTKNRNGDGNSNWNTYNNRKKKNTNNMSHQG